LKQGIMSGEVKCWHATHVDQVSEGVKGSIPSTLPYFTLPGLLPRQTACTLLVGLPKSRVSQRQLWHASQPKLEPLSDPEYRRHAYPEFHAAQARHTPIDSRVTCRTAFLGAFPPHLRPRWARFLTSEQVAPCRSGNSDFLRHAASIVLP
jgi:hypothetical protein